MRHLLQERQVELPTPDEGPRLPDVDGLDPIAADDVKHVHVGVCVDEEAPVAHGDAVGGGGGVHDLAVARLAALKRIDVEY